MPLQSPWPKLLVAAAFLAGPVAACAADPPAKTWTDGIHVYDAVLPLDGYFVPRDAFPEVRTAPLDQVLAAARRMTPDELAQYTRGGNPAPTRDYPLFTFKNHGVNVFLWKGTADGLKQILPGVWTGELWQSGGVTDGRAAAVEHQFYAPPGRDRCYVLVHHTNGQAGRDRLTTERIAFGALPPPAGVVRKGIEAADTAVYFPYMRSPEQSKDERLDCLKGTITRSEFLKLPGAKGVSYNSFAFISGTGAARKVRSTYREGELYYGSYRGDYGELSLRVSQVRKAIEQDPALNAYVEPGPLRWELARAAAGPAAKDAPCRLRALTPVVPRGEWAVVELTVGKSKPGNLYRPAMTRSQRDGGEALIRFEVRHGAARADLVPRGRFGSDPPGVAPEANVAVGVEHEFVDCGPGVLKLALRPKQVPWAGTIRGYYDAAKDPFGEGPALAGDGSETVRVEWK